MDWQAEADVLVVGGGGGGLVAAISAADEGASVVLIEKSPQLGGNSALSSGSVPGAGTRFQREAGIEDSPEIFAADVLRRTDNTAPRHLVELLARESAPLVEWLVDRVGAPLKLVPDLKKVGHSVPRTHAPPGREGSVLVQALERAANAKDVVLAPGHPVKRLILDDNGTIIGAAVEGNGEGVTDNIRARKVILAANGFGGNRDMLRKYCAEIAEAPYFGHQGNTGDAIRWGMELGADLANMAAYQGHASVAYPHGHLLSWTVMERGGFLINKEGRRFVDETLGYSACASHVRAQPESVAFAVFDTRTHEYLQGSVPEYADLAQSGGVRIGDDVGEMARAFGLPENAVRATLEEYHAGIAAGNDRFGRASFGISPLRPPFAMVRVTAGLFHTQGGLAVDSNAQPMRNGVPIANLYAVGGTAVGIAGADGGRGYVSASGLLAALGLGRVAGRHAARSLKETFHYAEETMAKRVWDDYLTERDRQVFESAGYGRRMGFGTRPALFVIDVQYNFCGDEPQPILEAVKKYRTACGEEAWQAVPHIERLMKICREKNLPIFYTVSERRPDMLDSGVQVGKSHRGREKTSQEGTHATQTVAPLAPRPEDFLIGKRKPSAFFGTPFMSHLNFLDIDTLIVTGCTTSGCVRATSVDAFSYNFKVVIPEETTFDRFQSSHAMNLFDLNCKYADVIPTDEVAQYLEGLPKRDPLPAIK